MILANSDSFSPQIGLLFLFGIVIAKLLPMFQEEAKKRRMSGLKNQNTSLEPPGSNDKTGRSYGLSGEVVGVGTGTSIRARQVKTRGVRGVDDDDALRRTA